MAQITPEQFQKKIEAKIRSLDIAKTIVFPVATVMLDSMRQRLFQEGISGDGGKIGDYSRKAMYVGRDKFINAGGFRPQGKKEYIKGTKQKKVEVYSISTRKKKKVAVTKGNTQRETMYLPNGYKELREIQGKETAFVNLQYSGLLFTDFSKLAVEKDTVVSKVGTKESSDKLIWLSDKYGKDTFKHTKEEREFFKKEVHKQFIKYLRS